MRWTPYDAPMNTEQLRLGAWARAQGLVGLVAALNGDDVTLFQPGDRQRATVPRSQVELVPAGAVTVTLRVDLPLPHGIGDDTVRRWVASLADPVVRARAASALEEAGLDAGAALPTVIDEVGPASTSGAVCLCGARTPAAPGTMIPCAQCGRQAASAPESSQSPQA